MTIVLGPDQQTRVGSDPPVTPGGSLRRAVRRLMKTIQSVARFAYQLLNDLF